MKQEDTKLQTHHTCYAMKSLLPCPSPLCNWSTLHYIVAHSVILIHPGHSSLLFVSFTWWLNFMLHMTLMNNSDVLPEQTLPGLCSCKLCNSRLTQLKKKKWNHISWNAHQVFLCGMKAEWDEGDGRILLGDNTSGEAVILQPLRVQCVEVLISTGLQGVCMYSWPYL